MRAVIITTFVSACLIGGTAAVVGDYGRAQVLRAKHFLAWQVSEQEKEVLSSENEELKSNLHLVTVEKDSSIKYKRTVEKRLEELNRVLESAITLSGAKQSEAKRITQARAERDSAKRPGIGGLEVDCGATGNCASDDLDANRTTEEDERIELLHSEKLIKKMEDTIYLLGRLPLGVPIRGEITSGFGVRNSPFSGRLAVHKGVDFDLNTGDPIRATGDGVISEIDRSSTYGLYVDIAHSAHITTRYAHLSSTNLKVGQKISRGSVIARGGSTGRSTGPHLHYEIRIDGKPKNPQAFLRLAERLKGIVRVPRA